MKLDDVPATHTGCLNQNSLDPASGHNVQLRGQLARLHRQQGGNNGTMDSVLRFNIPVRTRTAIGRFS